MDETAIDLADFGGGDITEYRVKLPSATAFPVYPINPGTSVTLTVEAEVKEIAFERSKGGQLVRTDKLKITGLYVEGQDEDQPALPQQAQAADNGAEPDAEVEAVTASPAEVGF